MKIFTAFFAVVLSSEWQYPEAQSDWTTTCSNQERGSPIDFRYTYEKNNYEDLGKFHFSPGYAQLADWDVTDNGHTLVFSNPTDKSGNPIYLFLSGGGLPTKYTFHSFHFHWGNTGLKGGSEHTVNGKKYFSEVHIVHHRSDCMDLGSCLKHKDGLAVLGFFLDVIDEEDFLDNLYLHRFISKIQRNHFDIGETEQKYVDFKLSNIFPNAIEMETFYRYEGSLTTPSCNEVVVWTVFTKPIYISPQLARSFSRLIRLEAKETKKVRGLYTKREYLQNNCRDVQDLNYRPVIISSPMPAMMHMIMSNNAILDQLKKEIDTKDNFSELLSKSLRL